MILRVQMKIQRSKGYLLFLSFISNESIFIDFGLRKRQAGGILREKEKQIIIKNKELMSKLSIRRINYGEIYRNGYRITNSNDLNRRLQTVK